MTEHGYRNPTRNPARDYLKEQDLREVAQRAAVATNHRLQQSRDWLASYRATSRPTFFNWSGKYPTITQEKDDHEDVEEAYQQTAAQAAEVSVGEGVGDAPEECSSDDGRDDDTIDKADRQAGALAGGSGVVGGSEPSFTEPPF